MRCGIRILLRLRRYDYACSDGGVKKNKYKLESPRLDENLRLNRMSGSDSFILLFF